MLILHQTGSVKVGEVVRYTLTYTPTADRILPAPSQLHVKIKNTSAIPLRAAYLHGPYTLYCACYPSTFDPNKKHERQKEEGVPDFEPNLKAGGHWTARLTVPEEIREAVGSPQSRQSLDGKQRSFTWIIEIASQIIFSSSASVHYEVLVGRDEKSVDLGFHGVVGTGQGAPGTLEDHQQGRSRNAAQPKGVFSKAVRLAVDDTESLWNTPPFPEMDEDGAVKTQEGPHHGDKVDAAGKGDRKQRKQKKVHLVILSHGIHSNIGADMLYLKESIDTAAKQAREDAKKRRAEMRKRDAEQQNAFGREASGQRTKSNPEVAIAPTEKTKEEDDDEDDDEQVLVRGFNGNVIKTEKGIQYLGKRLAKFVLSITYPDQPYLPATKSSISQAISRTFTGNKPAARLDQPTGQPIHKHSSIVKDEEHQNKNLAYKITSISFISHSLGGLVQTYAIAYIQKHSPEFFGLIKPINFVALATPFLGLSNENPIYVKFALDFGLVGRTGQDLGLTWRTPYMVRSGWGAMIGGIGSEQKKHQQPDPAAKPLLRILPTGPAHVALRKFRNRSVYSNVVNDGIVPLRTSCLLFLDWRGLERVEKARRENGVIGTMVGWGWAEMTGQNASSPRRALWNDLFNDSGDEGGPSSQKANGEHGKRDRGDDVPQAEAGENLDKVETEITERHQFVNGKPYQDEAYDQERARAKTNQQTSLWSGFMSMIRPQASSKGHHHPPKHQKPYLRGQTMKASVDGGVTESNDGKSDSDTHRARQGLVRGSSLYTNNSQNEDLQAPPKTTFFESAGDLLAPPLPPKEFLIDPASRPRTIFHDRVYHPEDIPAPPVKRQRTIKRHLNSREGSLKDSSPHGSVSSSIRPASHQPEEAGGMKIEEKIARAYHKDLSWRKVLVRLEPDAHNNMVVRRMFSNAYGWPVIKHICDTHFAYTAAATMADADERAVERAVHMAVGEEGEEVEGQVDLPDEEYETKRQEEIDEEARRPRSQDHHSTDQKVVSPDQLASDVKKLYLDLRSTPEKRTDSETREAYDEIAELVSPVTANGQNESSYSSLNSAKSNLSKLMREDSARWSDRFFEGSDDSDEDEEYLAELKKAQARGEGMSVRERKRAEKASSSSSSGGKGGSGVQGLLAPERMRLSPQQSTVDLSAGNSAAHVNDEAAPLSSLVGVGLRKSVDEQISPASSRREGSVSGVAEAVAVASANVKKTEDEL